MSAELNTLARPDGVKNSPDGTARHQARIELLECAGGGVPGIRKWLLSGRGEFCVQGGEILCRNVSFAADFKERRWILQLQLQWNRAHGAKIHRDVIPILAVAPRHAER